MTAEGSGRSDPRVFGLIIVRDAVDLIEINLRHHLALGLERLLVVDNGSDDGTLETLERLAAELPITVRSDTGAFRQADLTNRLAYEARVEGADWALPIDADEFFVASAPLPRLLGATHAGALEIEVVNFVQRRTRRRPSARGLLSMDHRPLRTIPQREARFHVEAGEWSMVEVAWHPKLAVRLGEQAWIGVGAHTVRGAAGPVEPTAEVVCLHAPLRARSAIVDRFEHAQRLDDAGADDDTGWQSRDLRRDEEAVDRLWRANSNHRGRLEVGGEPRPLVRDRRLRDAVAAQLPGPARARFGRRLGRRRAAGAVAAAAPPRPSARHPGRLPAEHLSRVEASRAAVLEAIGPAADVTFVRGVGNLGDELIWAGARSLLEGTAGREISIDELGGSTGEVAVLAGSGALCRPYHEWMPHAIAVAELRFERVVVLPSSVDVSEDSVRALLATTEATVFARERESLRTIEDLCDARLGLDSAFHFDYGRFADYTGAGTLDAFRTDAESSGAIEPPPSNDDVTASCGSLDEWLHRIASARTVRTDRAHVMIAAALLGKRVEYAAGSYHKLPAIAAWSLAGFDVSPIAAPASPAAERRLRPARPAPARRVDVGAVIATRDQPRAAIAALESVLSQGATAVVVDANSSPANRDRLRTAIDGRAELLSLERNPGRGAALTEGAARVEAGAVLLLDQGLALELGALESLAGSLAADPGAAAVTATVIAPEGAVEHSGGDLTREGDLVRLALRSAGATPSALEPSGACDWAPHSALLVRSRELTRLPPAAALGGFEDCEWALRAGAARMRVLRSTEALARRLERQRPEHELGFAERMRRLELAAALARIEDRHGVILDHLFTVVPELGGDLERGRALLALLRAHGPHAALADWDAGRLAPLNGGGG